MSTKSDSLKAKLTENFSEFSKLSDYSFMNSLKADPQSTKDGNHHKPRSVYSGHYVPVVPTAIPEPEYISNLWWIPSYFLYGLGCTKEVRLRD